MQDVVAAQAPVDLQARQAEDPDSKKRQRNLQHQDHGRGRQGGVRLPDRGHVDPHHLLGPLRLHPQAREGHPVSGGERAQTVR